MTTQTTTLADWLLERLAEDEAAASAMGDSAWEVEPGSDRVYSGERTVATCWDTWDAMTSAAHIARHDPDRVLREVVAKRALVEKLAATVDRAFWTVDSDPAGDVKGAQAVMADGVLRALASAYADAPGWQESWAL